MARKQKPEFPDLTCAACRFCVGQRDDWECWGMPPKPAEQVQQGKHNRGEPIDPNWPACHIFIARENG